MQEIGSQRRVVTNIVLCRMLPEARPENGCRNALGKPEPASRRLPIIACGLHHKLEVTCEVLGDLGDQIAV